MKTTKKITRSVQSKNIFCLKVAALAIAACFVPLAQANPVGPVVVNGAATVVNNGNTMTVTNTPGAILNWQQFNIGQGQTTQFNQQSAQSSVLNRVTGPDASQIMGTLRSNGQVFLLNPNGIMFGAGSVIDVNRLIASTLNITNADFLANNLKFNGTNNGTSVVNQGTITTPFGGSVYLIGNNVTNQGVITTPQGEVVLAAGNSVSMVNTVTPHVSVTVTAGGQAVNLGQVTAQGGSINIYGALVQQQGIVNADSASVNAQGNIVLSATQSVDASAGSTTSANGATGGNITIQSGATGSTNVAGTVEATGSNGTGGNIQVLGNSVALASSATLNASGTTGGGTILVGGDFQGKNAAVQNAFTTSIAQGATLKADATLSGNGGKIIAWSDNTTHAYGSFSARGGAQSGNGGLIETSGHYLDVAGIRIDAAALNGAAGTWLLDPVNVTIASTGTFAGSSMITDAAINAALNAGTSVTITTAGNMAVVGATIYKSANIAAPTLTLTASGDMYIDSTSVIDSVNNGFGNGLNVTISGNRLFMEGGIYTSSGNVNILATSGAVLSNGAVINTANGNVTMSANNFMLGTPAGFLRPTATLGSIIAGSGTLNITTTGYRFASGMAVEVEPGSTLTYGSLIKLGWATANTVSVTPSVVSLTNGPGNWIATDSNGQTHTVSVSASGVITCTGGQTCSAQVWGNGDFDILITNTNGTKSIVTGTYDPAANAGSGGMSGDWVNLDAGVAGTFTGVKSSALASINFASVAGNYAGKSYLSSGAYDGSFVVTISSIGAFSCSGSSINSNNTCSGQLLADGTFTGTSTWVSFNGLYTGMSIIQGTVDPVTGVISGTWADQSNPGGSLQNGTFTGNRVSGGATVVQTCLTNPILCASSPINPIVIAPVGPNPPQTGNVTYVLDDRYRPVPTYKDIREARKDARKKDDEAEQAEKHEKEAKTPKEKEEAHKEAEVKAKEADAARADAKIHEAEVELHAAQAEVKSAKTPEEKIRAEVRRDIAAAKRAEGETDKAAAQVKLAETEAQGAKTPEAKRDAEVKISVAKAELKQAEEKKAEADVSQTKTELKQVKAEAERSGSSEAKKDVKAKEDEIKKEEVKLKEVKAGKEDKAKQADKKQDGGQHKSHDEAKKDVDEAEHEANQDRAAVGSANPYVRRAAEKKAEASAVKVALRKAELEASEAKTPEARAAAETRVASLKAEANHKETEYKDAKRSSDSKIIEVFGGMALASTAKERVQTAMAARHEFMKETLKPALNILKANPNAADLKPCGAGGGDICMRPANPALTNLAGDILPRVQLPVLTPTTSFLPGIQRKVAVVIGNNAYQDSSIPSLNGAVNDADAVGKIFQEKMGYDVRMVHNGTRADIVRTLNKIADETGSKDSVVVYYAGHGYQMEDTKVGYWIPSDASAEDPSKWISNSDINKMLANIPAKQMILMSDSCFSGSLTSEQKVTSASAEKNVQDILGKRSVLVMSSGGEQPVMDEGREGHSVFTWHLLDKLNNVEQYKNGADVFEAVRDGVVKDGLPQWPQYGASVSAGHMTGGEYLFEVRKY